jgi:hypothetical protein
MFSHHTGNDIHDHWKRRTIMVGIMMRNMSIYIPPLVSLLECGKKLLPQTNSFNFCEQRKDHPNGLPDDSTKLFDL